MRLTVIRHEIVVGWFIVAALLLLSVGILVTTHSKGLLGGVSEYAFVVAHGRGLAPGAPVEIQGIPVGEVLGIELLKPGEVEVRISVGNKYAEHVKTDALARVVQPPLLGTTKVELEPGRGVARAAPGQRLATEEGGSLMGRIGELEGKVDDVIKRVDTFVGSAVDTLDEFRQLVDRIDSSEGLAGQVVHDPELAADVREAVASVKRITVRMEESGVDKAISTLDKSDALLTSLNAEDGEFRTLLRDVNDSVLALKTAINEAQVGETAATLRKTALTLSDTASKMEVSEETRTTLAAMQRASESFEDLAEALERQPNAVIFGRAPAASSGMRR